MHAHCPRMYGYGYKCKYSHLQLRTRIMQMISIIAIFAQNHRLNSRVPGSDGLDPTTSALFEARTLNVPLPPPLISTGQVASARVLT